MHQITIRLLLGIVLAVSQYKTQTSARIAADFAGCQQLHESRPSKAVYLNLHQHILEYYF